MSLVTPLGCFFTRCLEARQGNVSASIDRLRDLADAGMPVTAAKLDSDPDFEAIRQDPSFAAFMAQLRRLTDPR